MADFRVVLTGEHSYLEYGSLINVSWPFIEEDAGYV
jgi:hypothetical protein